MPEQNQDRPIDLGVYGRGTRAGFGAVEAAAAGLSLVWTAAVLAWPALAPEGSEAPGPVLTAVAILLPLALVWMAVATLRSVRALRDEAARLQAAVDAMRNAYVAQQQAAAVGPRAAAADPPGGPRTGEPAVPRRAPASLAERRAALAPAPAAAGEDQPGLALGTPAEDLTPPISVADFIAALNFPDSAEDKDGFRALRLALENRTTSKLIRASQDVLTLLSQDGIYMDDLTPDSARPDLWRRFAQGERGRSIAALGGIRDRNSLALTAGRMREDPVFRDAVHHFLRQFDRTFQAFEPNAGDADLVDLAETRTARAFMLCGRVSGTFD
jgi:type II secretory pathway pseudopilin PulG